MTPQEVRTITGFTEKSEDGGMDVCGKTNEVTAPSKKSNSNVKGSLGVEELKATL